MYPRPPEYTLSPEDLRWLEAQEEFLTLVEVPFIKTKRDKQFLPSVSERVFVRLVGLPGKSLAVYMVLLYRSRLVKAQTVPLTTKFLARFGISRHEKARALASLESAGLITVERRSHRTPLVTVLDQLTPI